MTGQLFEVNLDELDEGRNVRKKADKGLRKSIAAHGVLQPITVVRRRGRFEVLYGHRRVAAARALELVRIPAILVPEPDASERALRQLAENLDRKAVDPIDVARALRETLDANPGMTQAELAQRIGRSGYYVSTKLALLAMDPNTRRRVSAGSLGEVRAQAHRKASTVQGTRSRPRILELDVETGRSRSVVVPLGVAMATRVGCRATIGVELETGHVDVVLEDGAGASVMVTLAAGEARLLGRRLLQAHQAVAS